MQTIEREIVTELLQNLRAAGYQPAAVWDGEQYVMADRTVEVKERFLSSQPCEPIEDDTMRRPMTDDEALAAIDELDECTLHFTHHNKTTWGTRGVVLILGSGQDVISNYHDPVGEPFADIIHAISDRF